MSKMLENRYTFSIKSETPEDLPIDFFDLTLDDLKKLLLHMSCQNWRPTACKLEDGN